MIDIGNRPGTGGRDQTDRLSKHPIGIPRRSIQRSLTALWAAPGW